jgi:diacylglycerol O-acyltransferase
MTPETSTRRLSALDGSFLRLDTQQSPMHVGWSAVFGAPGDRPRPTVEAMRDLAAGRLHEVPWCRWRLADAPFGLSEPRWIEDASFDLGAHIVQLTGPDDAVSNETFETLRSTVLSAPLDRSRPLWQVFLVPRLADGRVGMVGKIHHALVDGIAALQIVRLFVDPDPDLSPRPPVQWSAAGQSGPLGWAVDAARYAVSDGMSALRAGSGAVAHPRSSVAAAARSARLIATAVAEDVLPPAPTSQLNGRIGSRRTLIGYHARRELLRAARGRGGTLNDVGLTAVAGALRTLALREGNAPVEPLKTMVPVSMRRIGEDEAGNQIAMVYMPLPIHLPTSGERLEFVREQTARLKHTDRPAATQAFVQAAGLVPPPLRTPLVRALGTPRQFNLTVSQSPAPRGSLYLLGCELEEVYSVVPIAQGHSLAIGMVRYRQELFFGCYADPDALPEVHELPALLAAELEQLAAAAAAERAADRADSADRADRADPPSRPARDGRANPNGRPLMPVG